MKPAFLTKSLLVSALVATGVLSNSAIAAEGSCPRWSVQNNSLLKELPRSLPRDGDRAARKLAQAYVDAGYLTVRVMPIYDECALRVYEMAADPRGAYQAHIPQGQVLHQDKLDIATNLMSREGFDRQERVSVGIGRPDIERNTVEVGAHGYEDDRLPSTSGGFVVTTLGPRYSGSTVASANIRHSSNGVRIEGNIAKSLPNVTQDSKGGNYIGGGAKVSTTVAGMAVVGAEVQASSYKVGGKTADLELEGKTTRVTAFVDVPLTGALTLETKLSHAVQDQEMGAFGFKDKQTSTTVSAGLRFAEHEPGEYNFQASTNVVQGIAGSREYSDYPLAGDFKKDFTALRADASFGAPLWDGSYLRLSAGGQASSKGTPGAESFFLGGADRGSGYHSGTVSGPSGIYAGAQLTLTEFGLQGGQTRVRPYVGLNGGRVKTNTGESHALASAEVGLQFETPWFLGSFGYARNVAGQDTFGDSGRANLTVSVPMGLN